MTLFYKALSSEGPTGHFRTLFFKGDTSGARTPSAWLLPNQNGIAIRVSTNSSADVGASSIMKSLPVKVVVYLKYIKLIWRFILLFSGMDISYFHV
jgi:hypothetical protein